MKYFIFTFGCEANKADSERIRQKLNNLGHKETLNKKDAGLIMINACSVRQSAIDRVRAKIMEFKNKKIILAGCLLESDKKKFQNKIWQIWHPNEYFDLIPLHSSPLSAFVPITAGCDNFCAYCAVPYTRGREKSRPTGEIIREVKNLIKKEYKEIWFLGQNVNSYKSGKTNFPKLLQKINKIPDEFQIRFLSPHPKDFSDELIKTITRCEKVVRYINLPVQSGDNDVLKKMNRNYTREQYIKLVKKIRRAMPDIKISTDIIVGFPGETKKQFQNTLKLCQEIKFDKAYVSKYSPRPGTMAAKMNDNVPFKEKKRRWQILDKLINPSTSLRASPKKKKLIVVLGPTSSGKSDLAVGVARKFNGEVISADSRQVYKGMDIGSGKITKKEMRGVKHYLLDVANPKKIFTAIDFKNMAEKTIAEILTKGKIPIVCGGTGFYIHALLGGVDIPRVAPDWVLRAKLEKKSCEELFKILGKMDPIRAKNIDSQNKRRLIRAIEILRRGSGQIAQPPKFNFDILYLGIKRGDKNLKELIHKRLIKRLKQGMIAEVKKLHHQGVSWKRLDGLGLEYRFVSRYLRGLLTKENMTEQLETAIIQYSKRQMTWFKKYPSATLRASAPGIYWVKNEKEAKGLVKKFLKL
ncbi:tRNA (adenosine(37)-N6)-dimethylallyltransferase MiaA [Patescibacteria group bacterium]|nr:tRNA (adenosine(37)-N6)-dimethylallyltransferase MiaA [Patescibacteria group bacterium]